MRGCLPFVAALLLVPSIAAAQTSRDDGIRALVRGDYTTAARILKALAENTTQPDPAAQFLLAILYDTGHGVTRNPPRACGLFLDAVKPDNPFMQQASQLSNLAREQLGPMASQLCVAGGTWPDNPPVTLTLGPNHTVVVADTTITVSYEGAEGHIGIGTLPGAVSLPIRHTAIDVSNPVAVRRHFLEWFIWVPDTPGQASTWSLGWVLYEVVGKDIRPPVTGERSLTVVSGARPPASVDLASLARVRVNASGEAEWVISGSTNPRSGVVPWKDPR